MMAQYNNKRKNQVSEFLKNYIFILQESNKRKKKKPKFKLQDYLNTMSQFLQ